MSTASEKKLEVRPLAPSPLGIAARLASSVVEAEEVDSSRAELAALAVRTPLALGTARALEAGVLEPEEITLAWEIARLVAPDAQADTLTLAIAVLEAARAGSTTLMHVTTEAADGQARGASPALGRRGSGAPLVEEGGRVALARWVAIEASIARTLSERGRVATAADAAADAARSADTLEPRRTELARARVRALRDEPLLGPRGPVLLTEEQEEAVASMLTERTLVLSGGPGTGKTSVVVALLRALARRGDDPDTVALAAPTGKAADRLGESVRRALASSASPLDAALAQRFASPTTLHRLLGYRHHDGTFRAHRENRLAHRLVLVDEVSMIDAALFERLLGAVAPESTLVLLGDPDQLPSVDPGAVLRDLLRARPTGVRFATLTRSHRMDPSDPDGAHVLAVARACLGAARSAATGSAEHEAPGEASHAAFRSARAGEQVVGRGGAWALPPEVLRETLDAWIERHLLETEILGPLDAVPSDDIGPRDAPESVRRALDHLARARVLTVTRRSAEEIDAYVSSRVGRWWQARSRAGERGPAGAGGARPRAGEGLRARALLPGEPVMAVRNDYDEDLWNGDSGVAFRDTRGETFVAFRRGAGVVTRPLGAIAHLVERAHAVTVHKAQGSEHDEVLFVLPATDTTLSSVQLVYTAITRARRSALVVGRAELLELALARRTARQTGLVEEIARARREGD